MTNLSDVPASSASSDLSNQIDSSKDLFLIQNQPEFAELLTFIDFAQGLTIAFIEVNQTKDCDSLVTALKQQLTESDIELTVLNFARERDMQSQPMKKP